MYTHLGISFGDGYSGIDDIYELIVTIIILYILFVIIPFYKRLKPWSSLKFIKYIFLPIVVLFFMLFIF